MQSGYRLRHPVSPFDSAFVPFGQSNQDGTISLDINGATFAGSPQLQGSSDPAVGASGVVARFDRQSLYLGNGGFTAPGGTQPATPPVDTP